ncbi:MAG: hypothetical protein SWJ54_06555 [Cyanobacteriota bacterium]|nr:hypothetical protein [Cyanobacteriota bacterium]
MIDTNQSENMLKIVQQSIEPADVETQMQLKQIEAKALSDFNAKFYSVISKPIGHFLQESKRVLKP